MIDAAFSWQAGVVPASFTSALCGYRTTKAGMLTDKPNMSDTTDGLSVRLGTALLDALGVARTRPAPANPGAGLELGIKAALQAARPDLEVARGAAVTGYTQYAHLDVLPGFIRTYVGSQALARKIADRAARLPAGDSRSELVALGADLERSLGGEAAVVEQLRRDLPGESILKVDIAAARRGMDAGLPELLIGVSAKWSLRTDRAQDCVSQGGRLVALRRGRMPHYAVVTIEPRPAMLKIIADGSGSVDCVYHLDLAALDTAIANVAATTPRSRSWVDTYHRLVDQRRLLDFDDLLAEAVVR